MSRNTDVYADLRTGFIRAIREKIGLPEHQCVGAAIACVEYARQVYGGSAPYIRKLAPDSTSKVLQDLAAGEHPDKVAERHQLHRSTVYRMRNKFKSGTGASPQPSSSTNPEGES